jgi:hypothetical protein
MKKFITVLAICSVFLTTSASAIIINFNDYSLATFASTSQGTGTGSVDVSLDGSTLELSGNLWRGIAIGYTFTSNTLLNFEFLSTSEGEIQGVAFENDNNVTSVRTFQLFGVQSGFGVSSALMPVLF